MKKQWLLGVLAAGALISAGLVACGSGDPVEVNDTDSMLLQQRLGDNGAGLSKDIAEAEKEYAEYCKENKCKESKPVEKDDESDDGDDEEVSSSSSKPSSSSKDDDDLSSDDDKDDDDLGTDEDDEPSSSSKKSSSSVKSSSSSRSEKSSSSESIKSSSSASDEKDDSSSSGNSGSGLDISDDGVVDNFTPGDAAALSAGTYEMKTCNGKSGAQDIQISSTQKDCWDAFENASGAAYWNNDDGGCTGSAKVTFPTKITVAEGKTLTLKAGCW